MQLLGNYDVNLWGSYEKVRALKQLIWSIKTDHNIDRLAWMSRKYLKSYLFHSLRSTAPWTPHVLLDYVAHYAIYSWKMPYSTHLLCADAIHVSLWRKSGKFCCWNNIFIVSRVDHNLAHLSVLLSTALTQIDLDSCSRNRKRCMRKWEGLGMAVDETMLARAWHGFHRLYCAIGLVHLCDWNINYKDQQVYLWSSSWYI